jgi:hypothetical protein
VNRFEWLNRVLSASGPESPTVRLVLVALLTQFYNEGRGYAFPGAATLAERTGHCEKTVRTALVEAETVGWLRRDPMPGHVTHYYPTVPENRDLRLTPVSGSGVGRQRLPGTPVTVTDDLRKELMSPEKRKAGKPPACPLCSAPMREERSKRTKEPMFWGCTRFRTAGCRGRVEFGEEPDPERERAIAAEKTKNSDDRKARQAQDNERAVAELRAMAEAAKRARGRSALPSTVTDARGIAEAALSGALRHPERVLPPNEGKVG